MGKNVKKNIVILSLDYSVCLKTAQKLAERLDMYFLDIQGLYSFDIKPRTVSETISKYGMDYYRNEISGSIKYASSFDNSVIAIESGAVENSDNMEKLREHCLLVYVRSFPRWVTNKDFDGNYNSKEEEVLYKLADKDIIARDNVLCKDVDIIAYGDDRNVDSFVEDIIRKIIDFYGVD